MATERKLRSSNRRVIELVVAFFLGSSAVLVGGGILVSTTSSNRSVPACETPTKSGEIDVAKYCHILEHNDSDGFYYWSCDENKGTHWREKPR